MKSKLFFSTTAKGVATAGWPAVCLLLVLAISGCTAVAETARQPESQLTAGDTADFVVLSGIDVLRRDEFRQLDGRNIGLITNHTGIDRGGVTSVQRLHQAGNLNLVALFSPEHGIRGKLDISLIDDSTDLATGLNIFSLYGETRQPTAAMLDGIDTLVFDIQDIGTRFYTYISTMGLAMQAAAEHGVKFVVLDRPNPVNGVSMSGPVLDDGRQSFTGFHRLPVRHGMTIGELALMFRDELPIDLDLEVIRMEGWKRRMFFDETGLPWVNPSPNIRRLAQAVNYPGIGLLESSNLSVGRGTNTPFEHLGAPWLDGEALAAAMNRLKLPGVRFLATSFTPTASKFAGERCNGIALEVYDRNAFEPVRAGIGIALALRALHPEAWEFEAIDRLLVNEGALLGIRDGMNYDRIETGFHSGLEKFIARRSGYLLYE